jgi:hypothetical protein
MRVILLVSSFIYFEYLCFGVVLSPRIAATIIVSKTAEYLIAEVQIAKQLSTLSLHLFLNYCYPLTFRTIFVSRANPFVKSHTKRKKPNNQQ